MKKLSLQWRITLMTALLTCSTCMAMNWLIGCSGRHYMDSIGANLSTAIDPSEGAVEYFDPSREGLDPNLTIVIYGAQNSFTATNWYITAAVTLLGGILAYFVSGRALRPLRTFVAQVEKVQPNNLADMKITEEVLPEFRQFSDSFNQMLERLDEGFTAQRQFTGNAAHELRTPLALMTGCGNNDAQDGDAGADGQDTAKETLVVGLDDTFAPMGFRDEQGNLVGFDIDLATAVADELGMQAEFKPIDWNAKEMELKAGTIDCVWNGMSITPERQENMALTNKYLNNKIVLMALADADIDVTSAKELADLKIGTQVDSSALQMLMANEAYESFKDNISEYETYDTAIMDLKAGRVDVIAVDQVLGEYTNNNLGGEMKECTYSLGDDYYVIGFEKSNTALRDKVNDAIKAVIDSGKAAEISSKWFGKDIVVFEPIA